MLCPARSQWEFGTIHVGGSLFVVLAFHSGSAAVAYIWVLQHASVQDYVLDPHPFIHQPLHPADKRLLVASEFDVTSFERLGAHWCLRTSMLASSVTSHCSMRQAAG